MKTFKWEKCPRFGPVAQTAVILIAVGWSACQSGEWKKIPGAPDRPVFSTTIMGNTLVVGTSTSVFISKDGAEWIENDSLLPNTAVRALATNGSELFSGNGYGLLRTTGIGSHWTPILNGGVDCLAISGDFLFGTNGKGIFRMPIKGEARTVIGEEFGHLSTLALFAVNGVVLAGTTGGIFRSTDQGDSWSLVAQGWPDVETGTSWDSSATCFAIGSGVIFAGTEFSGVVRSNDTGKTWHPAGRLPGMMDINDLLVSGTTVVAACGVSGKGIFVSTNNGASWLEFNEGFPPSPNGITNVKAYGIELHNSILYAGISNMGVWQRPFADAPPMAIKPRNARKSGVAGWNPGKSKIFDARGSHLSGSRKEKATIAVYAH